MRALVLLLILLGLAACAAPQATQSLIQVEISTDGETRTLQLPSGSTVQQALDQSGLSLGNLDRTEPAVFTVLSDGAQLRVIRVTEEFQVEQVVLPFERQTLRNESLPIEKEVLIQRGKNGLQEITYRRVLEDGIQVSSQPIPVNSIILAEPVPEIRMIGVQTPFSPVDIPGKIYYIRGGNLWQIEATTNNRRAVLTTGDMDGRILSFSADGEWVLFTRRSAIEGRINSLWAGFIGAPDETSAVAATDEPLLVDLQVSNVIHFADWAPDSNTKIYFSTVEPRPTAPGWQANNDLHALNFSPNGWTSQWTTIVETNSGGVYGWWGTQHSFSPDQSSLSYARPDSIGLVDYKTGTITKTLDILPLQTFGDWAWVPGTAWGPDGKSIYTTIHEAGAGAVAAEESPDFALAVIFEGADQALDLIAQTGMFAYPQTSPLQETANGEVDYQIAFLLAQSPEQSQNSRYRLMVMDRDGSNRRLLFPSEDKPGLQPQAAWGAWSPERMPGSSGLAIALIYEGNLWLVNVQSGEAIQVTADGLTTRVSWQ